MAKPLEWETDVVVVGSGPGGATVARALARAGRSVLVLERGRDRRRDRFYGTVAGAMTYADRGGLLFSEEGVNLIRPLLLGGATSMYCGCAAPPPAWLKDRYGVDLSEQVEETIRELGLAPLPPELRGPGSTRIAEAGDRLGVPFLPQLKFVTPYRRGRFDCSANCMLGCRCGSKWNAAEWVDDAVEAGAVLRTGAFVSSVLISHGTAEGVEGRVGSRPFRVRAPAVVLAAGGIGTPLILRASGFEEAGRGFTVDTTTMLYGAVRGAGNGVDPPMTWSHEPEEGGYLLSTLVDPWLSYPLINGRRGLRYARTWTRWGRTLGVMIKLKDDVAGGVFGERSIRKPLTDGDRGRLARAQAVARDLLLEAGAEEASIFRSPFRGTHPGSTARMGVVVDTSLATRVPGLWVSDASTFPEALGRPTVLTIIALAKRLANGLLDRPLGVTAAP